MHSRSAGFTVAASLCIAGLTACAGAGSSSTHLAAVPGVPNAPAAPVTSKGARHAANVSTGTCSNDTGDFEFLGVPGASIVANGANAVDVNGSLTKACEAFAFIGTGDSNVIAGGGDSEFAFIGDGNSNAIGADAHESAIVDGANNGITGTYNLIGDGYGNTITANPGYSAIAGGYNNSISATEAFVGGGISNAVTAQYGAIAGGTNNSVSGAGGYIGSGGYNLASGEGAVVDGGYEQIAGGLFATIPGGYRNSAAGTYSFAAGAFASASHNGAFVWSDGSDGSTVLGSAHPYQFVARAAGGFALYTNPAASVGAQLPAGSGTWASLSDRNAKTDIIPLDDRTVLEKVAALPISRWSYRTERGVRHAGPMAQDFYAAFKLGEDDRHITSIDEDGVALAAIKALHAENARLQAENQRLGKRVAAAGDDEAALRARVRELAAQLRASNAETRAQISALRAAVAALSTSSSADAATPPAP